MEKKIENNFPDIWSIITKLPSSYNLEQKIVIALYALKEDVVEDLLTYIYPFDFSTEFDKITRTVAEKELRKKATTNQTTIKSIIKNVLQTKNKENEQKLKEDQKKFEKQPNNALSKQIIDQKVAIEQSNNQLQNIEDDGAVGAGSDGQQIFQETTGRDRKKRISFGVIFKYMNVDKIKEIINSPSENTSWTNVNTIDTNGDTILTWALSQNNNDFTKFAANLVLNDINNSINVNHKNDKEQTAISISIKNGYFTNKETRNVTPIIKYLIEKGAHIDDNQKLILIDKGLYNQDYVNDCTDYILEKNILKSTSGYGGFKLCPLEPGYIQAFLDSCVKYYGDEGRVKSIIHGKYGSHKLSLLGLIGKKTAELTACDDRNLDDAVRLRCELKSLLNTYELLQQLLSGKLTPIYIVSYLFTSWIKFIFPIGSSDESIDKTYKLITDLLTSLHKYIINENVFGLLGIDQKYKRYLLNIDPLKSLIFNMIFHLVPPDEALVFKVKMLRSYNILSFYKRNVRIENQNIIMALIHDFNIASIESYFKNVYRIPVDIPTGKTEIYSDFETNTRWKNMETGIETIIALMNAPSDNLKKEETLDVIPKTAPIRKKLAETDEARAFFIYAPTEDMFFKDLNSSQFYTFYDILCSQYFQEYKEIIDKEHLITSAKLRYLCNYAATTTVDGEFNLIMSIIEFALVSYFVQNQLTGECNRAAGTKPRWSQTIEQYRRILTFICKLYLSKTIKETIYMTVNGNSSTTKDYCERMVAKSTVINNSDVQDDFKSDFIDKPTIILPNRENDDEVLINKASPLINYGFDISVLEIEKIGAKMNILKGERRIRDTINGMFNNKAGILAYSEITKIIAERVDSMYIYEDVTNKYLPIQNKNKFGTEPGLSEEALLLLQIPSFDVIDERIGKMIELVDRIEKEHPKDDVFEKVISFRKSTIIVADNTNKQEDKQIIQYRPPSITNSLRKLVGKV